MIHLLPGDYIQFNKKLYQICPDRDGNPCFQRIYLSSTEAFYDSKVALEDVVKKVNISINIPM